MESMEPMWWSLAVGVSFYSFSDQCSNLKKEESSDVDCTLSIINPLVALNLSLNKHCNHCFYFLAGVTKVETSCASGISGGQLWWGPPELLTVFTVVGPSCGVFAVPLEGMSHSHSFP